eukprot:8853729-Pyramimonas_sp.AAC.1
MHLVELGIAQYFIARALIELLKVGFFGYWSELEPDSADIELQQALDLYYEQHRTPTDVRVTSISTAQVDVTSDNPKIALKAARTRYLLPVFVHLLEVKGGAALINRSNAGAGSALLECGKSMVGYINLCRSEPRQMSPAALAKLGQLTDTCFRKWVEN